MSKITNVNSKIRLIRLAKGYSQEYMASKLSINQGAYGGYEKEGRNITVGTLSKLAEIFEVHLSAFFTDATPSIVYTEQVKETVQFANESNSTAYISNSNHIQTLKESIEHYKLLLDKAHHKIEKLEHKIEQKDSELQKVRKK